jgi:hypothetical protein
MSGVLMTRSPTVCETTISRRRRGQVVLQHGPDDLGVAHVDQRRRLNHPGPQPAHKDDTDRRGLRCGVIARYTS